MLDQFRTLWELMRGQRLRYAAAIGAIVLASLVGYLVPLVAKATIDGAIPAVIGPAAGVEAAADEGASHGNALARWFGGASFLANHLWLAALAMVTLTGLAGLFTYLRGRWSAVACEAIARRLRDQLQDHLQHLPATYHDKADTGDLVQRCTSDVETVRLFLASQVVEIGHALILLLTVIPLMLWLDVPMAAVSLALVPVVLALSVEFFRRVKHRFLAVDEAEGRMTKVLQENLTGIRVVKAFARQDFECEKFDGPSRGYRDLSFGMTRLMAAFWVASDFLCMTQTGLALAAGAYWVAQGRLTVGTLYAFLAYLQIMIWPVRHMGRTLTDLGKAVVALGRVREVLEAEREGEIGPREAGPRAQQTRASTEASSLLGPWPSALGPSKATPAFNGALEIRGLTFAHAGTQPVLRDISLRVEPGQTLALVGPSGSGKSTLVHLLLRLYDYETGSIKLDGHEIRDLPRKLVRAQFGVVLQEPFLFAKSLRENIRLGRPSAREEEVAAAAEAAAIHATIASFEKGYDTLLGERGVNLSGGQRQRMAIARAVIRDPAVLVLDDALSAVDSKTESLILAALRRRHGRRTTILIAHRLGTLARADRILVLDGGRIVQSGTHERLAREGGLYARLWRIQASLEEDLRRELEASPV